MQIPYKGVRAPIPEFTLRESADEFLHLSQWEDLHVSLDEEEELMFHMDP